MRWSRLWLAQGARVDGLPASGACASEPGCRPAPALPEDQESSGGKKHAYLPASAEPGVRSRGPPLGWLHQGGAVGTLGSTPRAEEFWDMGLWVSISPSAWCISSSSMPALWMEGSGVHFLKRFSSRAPLLSHLHPGDVSSLPAPPSRCPSWPGSPGPEGLPSVHSALTKLPRDRTVPAVQRKGVVMAAARLGFWGRRVKASVSDLPSLVLSGNCGSPGHRPPLCRMRLSPSPPAMSPATSWGALPSRVRAGSSGHSPLV